MRWVCVLLKKEVIVKKWTLAKTFGELESNSNLFLQIPSTASKTITFFQAICCC